MTTHNYTKFTTHSTQYNCKYDRPEYDRELEKDANLSSKFASIQNWQSYLSILNSLTSILPIHNNNAIIP
ncbi:MAG: hypothetical protein B6242_11800 [Anaerolineaceae bacterium 4572_78]|nr:MAG: hypothetical protein B6242_11800 [Anaerolineaceae bacterium 4572_78]